MKLFKRLKCATLIVCLLFLLTGCMQSKPEQSAGGPAPAWAPKLPALSQTTVVNVGMKQVTSDAGILIGMAKGYYSDLGIKINPVQFNTGQEMINQLAAGQLDVGATVSSSGLYNAMSRDIPIKIVADKGINVPNQGYYRLVIRKGLEDTVKDYADLQGRKMAVVGAASLDELSLERVLNQGNMTLKDVDVQVIRSFPDMLVALSNQSIDAAMVIEPFITQGKNKDILSPWKDPVEYDPFAQTALLVFGTSLTQNPEVANRFMTAYIKSVRDYNDAFFKQKDKAAMVDILCKYSVVKDAKLYEMMYPVGLNPDGYLKTKGIELDLAWYKKNQMLKSDLMLKDVVDHQYVDFARSILGPYE